MIFSDEDLKMFRRHAVELIWERYEAYRKIEEIDRKMVSLKWLLENPDVEDKREVGFVPGLHSEVYRVRPRKARGVSKKRLVKRAKK